MKRIFLIAAFALPLLWTACSDNPAEVKEDVVPKGMKAIDLTHLGFPLKINIPDSNFFPTVDTMETPVGIEIRIGQHYNVLINGATPEDADLAKQKELIAASSDAGVSNFITSDSSTLVWETKFGDLSMMHFYHIVSIGNDKYYVRDNNNNPDNQFNKDDINRMLESAKSLRAKPAAAEKPEA